MGTVQSSPPPQIPEHEMIEVLKSDRVQTPPDAAAYHRGRQESDEWSGDWSGNFNNQWNNYPQ